MTEATIKEPAAVAPVPGPSSPLPARRRRRRISWTAYALLAPGLLWLIVFFVAPMITTLSTSLQEGNVDEGFVFTGNVGIYVTALQT